MRSPVAPLPRDEDEDILNPNRVMDRSFLVADIDKLLKVMTDEEKISLLAGKDRWTTVPIQRLNIPSIKMTDGPNGARGGSFFKMTPAVALPCATCMAATFSLPLARRVGELLAEETKARKAVCLLAPTVNIARNPLGGRTFEQFGEDPTLSGLMAAAYIRGVQSQGISTTIKHLVANEMEHERNGQDSIIDARTLREVYLRPFQIVQRLADPWAYMTSYNKLNGIHCSENPWLLQKLLADEWGFGPDGFIMSDWNGTYSIDLAIKSGLTLEMPGPARFRQVGLVQHMLKSQKLSPQQLNKAAKALLKWVQRLARANPQIVYEDAVDEITRDDPTGADHRLARQAAVEGIVLLKNEPAVLPIRSGKVAVIGPNAKAKVLTGGGAAQLNASWSQTPWQGILEGRPEGVQLEYALGCHGSKFLPCWDETFTAPSDGKPGFDMLYYPFKGEGYAAQPVYQDRNDTSDMFMYDFHLEEHDDRYVVEILAEWVPDQDGVWEHGLVVTGRGWLWVDETLVVDNATKQDRPGTSFLNLGTKEKVGQISVKAGKRYKVRVVHDTRAPPDSHSSHSGPIARPGVRMGFRPLYDPATTINEAVNLASQCDTAVIVAGLNKDWESEGYDRPDLSMPYETDELISRISAVCPRVVVVIQAGSAVTMPWASKVQSIIYAWYLGNESGHAIADIIYGHACPSGRLPLTLPRTETDVASATEFKSARGAVTYSEGIWVGYKHHNARGIPPLFPFGRGLSYTTWAYDALSVRATPHEGVCGAGEWGAEVEVEVKNTGAVTGSHAVLVWVEPPPETPTGLKVPQYTLQAFDKVHDVPPGESRTVRLKLDKYAVSHWDVLDDEWKIPSGRYTVHIGIDAQTMVLVAPMDIHGDMSWRGL